MHALLVASVLTTTAFRAPHPIRRRTRRRSVGTALDDVTTEATKVFVPYEGAVPAYVRGTYYRNGPGAWTTKAQNLTHLFDGFALLCSFAFRDGGVELTSKFLASEARAFAVEHDKLLFNEFGTAAGATPADRVASLVRSSLRGGTTDNAVVNVLPRPDGTLLAISEPTSATFRVDGDTLATLGRDRYDGGDSVGLLHTAHPLPRLGKLVNVATSLAPPRYEVYVADDGLRNPRRVASLPSARAFDVSWHHAFAATATKAVVVETPAVYNVGALMGAVGADHVAFDWKPEGGTWVTVVDIASGAVVARRRCERNFFFFHCANAFEEDGSVRVDLCVYDDARIVDGLSLAAMRRDPAVGGVERVPRRQPGRRGRHRAYAVGAARPTNVANVLTKTDCDARTTNTLAWPGVAVVGEPLFVPDPAGAREDDGALLVVLHDVSGDAHVAVVDARTFAEVARATMPRGAVPYGFHGAWRAA
ncbi:oxidoreductase [Aureococcus anophagefferens]|nr:oxidoreductase [Aureococcus anophagefferens]